MTSAQGILWRLVRIPLIPVVLYLVLRPVHGADGYLALAAIPMVMRVIALVIVPAYLVYRLVVAAVIRLPGGGR
ncbi:hypothetical protein ACFRAQ_18485 [Nocardia sp. NPDC056611]|uniref:hypothetical protein n=1 Tax=Nocardia sp. NPDC056611 TaxID=3345877 RepID=UPI0036727959